MQPSDPQFRLPPFPAFPSVTRYVALGSTADTMSRISRSIDAREGVSLVIGPPGTGKSLICALIEDEYRDTHEVAVLGETPIEDQAAFLRHLLHHLTGDFESIPERDLQLKLIDQVCDPQSPAGGLLLVVDEAQSMSDEVLESIRMVTNIMRDGEPRVHAVVCGGVKLDETLSAPSMEAFTQRVATRCYLHPMSGEETRDYVCETIRRCGAEPEETITDEAIAAVHHACDGVPRLINHMLTQAIDCAEAADQSLITEQLVDRAWAELQQLPSPMLEEPSLSGGPSPIEFGELDESYDAGQTPSEPSATNNLEFSDLSDETQVEPCQTSLVQYEHESESIETADDCDAELIRCEASDPAIAEHVVDTETNELAEHQYMTETMVPPSAVLFGDFEEEEEVVVGSGVSPTATPPIQEPANDLESMLHQEIVSIASEAAQQVAASDARQRFQEKPESALELDTEPQPVVNAIEGDIEISDEDCQWSDEPPAESAEPVEPVLWLNESDADDLAGGGQDCPQEPDLRICDDQDLLVIEDDVEITAGSIGPRIDSHQETISVDFQAMLARMRSST